MNVLIVGGAGFLGANLVRTCIRDNANRVTVLDSLEPRLRASTDGLRDVRDRIRFVHGDMRDTTLMADLVPSHDVIFNCAGQTSHPLSMQQPAYDAELNVLGNLALLEAMRIHNRDAVVVYTSSSTVVGKAVTSPIDESHPEAPLDIYSANKLVGEKYYRIYNKVHGLKTVILRFPNLYGPYGKGYPEFGFVNYFIHIGRTGGEIKIFGSGAQTRNLVYVTDACDVMIRAASQTTLFGEPTFVANDEHVSVREIAETIISTFRRGTLTHIEWPEDRRRIEVDDVKISAGRLHELLHWKPRHSFQEGLVATKKVFEDMDSRDEA